MELENKNNKNKKLMFSLGSLAIFIIVVVVQLYVGKYLWNNTLVKLIPSVSPVGGILDILFLIILIAILFGGTISACNSCYNKCNEYVCDQ